MNFGANSQSQYQKIDSTYCLTESQVKETVIKFRELDMCKIEYKHALDTLYLKEYKLDSLTYANENITAYNEDLQSKVKSIRKTRNTSIVAAILFMVLSIVAN